MENFETDDFEEYSDIISWKEARFDGIITYGEEKNMGDILEKYCKKLEKENEELKSIIKEVREYINNTIDIKDTKEIFEHFNKIETILDKENNKIYGDKLNVEWFGESILDKDSDKE